MTKKVTISVPDELHGKMEKWKDSFNFSKVFQGAISEAIQKKENFQTRLKEVTTMEQAIERLKREKTEAESDYFEQGKKDGLEFAKSASYEDLQYAICWEPMNRQPGLIGYDPTRDEVLGEYFDEIGQEDPHMEFEDTTMGHSRPNDLFAAWEEGWVEGVSEFWDEVKDKI